MRFLISTNKTFLFLILTLILFSSCVKNDCINLEKSDRYMRETQSWRYDNTLGNRTFTDDFQSSQTLQLIDSDSAYFENSVEDDCGIQYDGFMASTQFITSMSAFNFMITLNAGAFIPNEYDQYPTYTIDWLITPFNEPEHHKNITVDLVNKKVIDGYGTVDFLKNHPVNGYNYRDVIKVTFDWMFSDNDIKTLYYAKHFGIIEFVNGYQNHYRVVPNP